MPRASQASPVVVNVKVSSNNNVVAKSQTPQIEAIVTNYDIAVYIEGKSILPAEKILALAPGRTVSFANNFANSIAVVGTPPAVPYVIGVYQNANSVGNITFQPNGASSFATYSNDGVTFVEGDLLILRTPVSVDLSITDISITLVGTRA